MTKPADLIRFVLVRFFHLGLPMVCVMHIVVGCEESRFEEHVITTNVYISTVYAADVDNDGDTDVLSSSKYDEKIMWYENNMDADVDANAAGAFTERTIAQSTGAESVSCADFDGDGDMDVVAADDFGDRIVWYENTGTELGADTADAFTEHDVTTDIRSPDTVFAIDMDIDGDMDVLAISAIENKIAWYENGGTELGENMADVFTEHVISTEADFSALYPADVDGDGDLDVLSVSSDDIVWYENTGTEVGENTAGEFTKRVISSEHPNATAVYGADIDGDGDLDVLAAASWMPWSDKVAWYENTGTDAGEGSADAFTQHVITTNSSSAHSVYAADVDSDGDMDVLSAGFRLFLGDRVTWYENTGTNDSGNNAGEFTQHDINTVRESPYAIYPSDVDGDGNMDILASFGSVDSEASGDTIDTVQSIVWFQNTGGN